MPPRPRRSPANRTNTGDDPRSPRRRRTRSRSPGESYLLPAAPSGQRYGRNRTPVDSRRSERLSPVPGASPAGPAAEDLETEQGEEEEGRVLVNFPVWVDIPNPEPMYAVPFIEQFVDKLKFEEPLNLDENVGTNMELRSLDRLILEQLLLIIVRDYSMELMTEGRTDNEVYQQLQELNRWAIRWIPVYTEYLRHEHRIAQAIGSGEDIPEDETRHRIRDVDTEDSYIPWFNLVGPSLFFKAARQVSYFHHWAIAKMTATCDLKPEDEVSCRILWVVSDWPRLYDYYETDPACRNFSDYMHLYCSADPDLEVLMDDMSLRESDGSEE